MIWLLLALGCNDGEEEVVCDHEPPLTWENHGRGFVEQYCTGCHSSLVPLEQRNGAPLTVDFDTYAGVLDWHDRIKLRVPLEAPTMPPGGGPTTEEYVDFNEWLDCAAADDLPYYEAQK